MIPTYFLVCAVGTARIFLEKIESFSVDVWVLMDILNINTIDRSHTLSPTVPGAWRLGSR